jgi:NADH:ubiquinone oxidoreductase subunit 6 (subunit J)
MIEGTVIQIIFYALAALTIISALFAAFESHIVHAAFALFFTLLSMAGFYVLLGADYLAITQIVIYVGGILVLLLIGVLLTRRLIETLELETRKTYLWGGLAGILFYCVLLFLIFSTHWKVATPPPPSPTTAPIGNLILNRYLLPFEFSSITLLIALIGAAYLVRRRD